jgi:hypothetical protein
MFNFPCLPVKPRSLSTRYLGVTRDAQIRSLTLPTAWLTHEARGEPAGPQRILSSQMGDKWNEWRTRQRSLLRRVREWSYHLDSDVSLALRVSNRNQAIVSLITTSGSQWNCSQLFDGQLQNTQTLDHSSKYSQAGPFRVWIL